MGVWLWKATVWLWKMTKKPLVCARFWEWEKWWFLSEIPEFYQKFWNFREFQEIFLRIPQLLDVFGPARPGCARPYKTNGILSLFRGFGSPWAHFPQKIIFRVKIIKHGKRNSLLDFQFLCENQYFCEIQQIAKTPIILMDYWWFWGVFYAKTINSTKITKNQEIPRNFINSR